ncbi:GNAT family N-acetyltransferase [Mycoplasmatota bacterium]|nr:GNAT family N-acetyltransferase [Mycoplasmatota bacterium]
MIIETERLLVRNFKEEDWKDLQEYIIEEEVLKFESDWDSTDEGCKKAAMSLSQSNAFWAVELKTKGKMIGHVYFNQAMPKKFLSWNLGYIFNPKYYGKGYATEACKAIIQYGFDNLQIHRVSARCNPDNIKSWKLLERILMRREGNLKKSYFIKRNNNGDPIWWDEYEYGILREEWEDIEYKIIE